MWSKILLTGWALILMTVFGSVTGLHLVPHKTPEISGLRDSTGFVVHHFISQYCGCSKNIFKRLKTRKKLPEINEMIHLVGDDKKLIKELEKSGFQVELIKEEEAVEKYNLSALPLIVIVHNNRELHRGGYGKNQQHSTIYDDVSIIQKMKELPNRTIASYPVFGCANGKLKKSIFDIWSLKYER